MKQSLKKINGNSVEEKLSRFLLKHRITPHTTTGIPPSELLMGRRLRSKLDMLHPGLSGHVEERQWKQKQIHDKAKTLRKFKEGDQVYAKDFSAPNEKWIPGVVQKVTSYHIQLHDGRVIRRHIDNMKSRSTGQVKKEKGDKSEHNLPAMQNVGFEAGISSSVTENREATTSEESVLIIPVPTPNETPSPTTQIQRSERCHPPPSYMSYDQNFELST